jgi:DNA-binding MarR family transcriptional regulator
VPERVDEVREPPAVVVDAPTIHRLVGASKRAQRMLAARFEPLGIHPGQDRLLSELWLKDGLSQTELIERLSVEPPTVTGTLQRLERDGFVRREPDSSNRRISRVLLTEAGRELERPVREAWREAEAEIGRDLSPAERDELVVLLDKVYSVPNLGAE